MESSLQHTAAGGWLFVGMRVSWGDAAVGALLRQLADPGADQDRAAVAVHRCCCYPVVGLPALRNQCLGLAALVAGEAGDRAAFGTHACSLCSKRHSLPGNSLGIQMGFSLVNVLDPQTQADTPVLAIFHRIDRPADVSAIRRASLAAARTGPQFSLSCRRGTCADRVRSRRWFCISAGRAFGWRQCRLRRRFWWPRCSPMLRSAFWGRLRRSYRCCLWGLSVKSMLGLMVLLCGAMALWPRFFERAFSSAHGPEQNDILKLATLKPWHKTTRPNKQLRGERQKAREKGQIARSRDLSGDLAALAAIAGCWPRQMAHFPPAWRGLLTRRPGRRRRRQSRMDRRRRALACAARRFRWPLPPRWRVSLDRGRCLRRWRRAAWSSPRRH